MAEIILPDGRNVNREIVRAGLAWWYRRYAARDHTLQGLVAEGNASLPAKLPGDCAANNLF